MDALSEMLRVITLDSAVYFNAEFSEPWRLTSPEPCILAPALAGETAHVINYHLLSEGGAYLEVDGERVMLTAGDLFAFPHGDEHVLGSGARVTPIDTNAVLPAVLEQGLELLRIGGGGARARFIFGFLVCDRQLSEAFLGGLPRMIRVNIRKDPSGEWLENSLRFAVSEVASRKPGAKAMLAKLSEVVFAETLRRYVAELPEGQTGWLAGARDADVGRALTLLHHRHAHPWPVAELAREAGTSRTVLAERFRHFLGEAPMAYLTRWRLRLGARALTATSHGVAQIAIEVGYESESAFNRAFKREYGLPPARYRRDKAEQRALTA
ncbi:AraC family transcriptional regulator [soil metagenome]